VGNYWVTAQPQYRMGSPNGLAVLQYEGANDTLPDTPTPQPGAVEPWTEPQAAMVSLEGVLLLLHWMLSLKPVQSLSLANFSSCV